MVRRFVYKAVATLQNAERTCVSQYLQLMIERNNVCAHIVLSSIITEGKGLSEGEKGPPGGVRLDF